MLVAVAYYIGTEKKQEGVFSFVILAYTSIACMITSEVFAKFKQRKRRVSPAGEPSRNQLIIYNFIPFTTLNVIFATGFFISGFIRLFQRTQTGFPNLSIHAVIMLLCLLGSNSAAKKHFRRHLGLQGQAGVDVEVAVVPTVSRTVAMDTQV